MCYEVRSMYCCGGGGAGGERSGAEVLVYYVEVLVSQ